MQRLNLEKLELFPFKSTVNENGHLQISGCDCVNLARKYGTPLYILDEFTIRTQCRKFITEFKNRNQNTDVLYACKAFFCKALALLLKQEGMGLDVVSGGELAVAIATRFACENIYFHGNNKSATELAEALNYRVGHIVVDNFYELRLLNNLARKRNLKQKILLRLSPSIDAHTHKFTTTGVLDSKFGFALATGQAEEATALAMQSTNLDLVGLHCHLGSPIFETSPYELAINLLTKFAKEMNSKYGFVMQEFSPGGGYAVQYMRGKSAPTIEHYSQVLTDTLRKACHENEIVSPKFLIEPGRSIIAQAGVALYTVGAMKEIPGLTTYVFVDGGMGDNIRPALYDAQYEALVANKAGMVETLTAKIAGRYCESGDVLIKDTQIAQVNTGDLIAMPVSGAYALPMSSNYNMATRPAVIMIGDGKSRLIRRRETYKDLIKLDLT